MGKSISHLSDEATQQTNTTGVTTPILEVSPDNGTMLSFSNSVGSGSEVGMPVFAKLRDANGNNLPADTSLLLRAFRPTDDEPVAVSVSEDNIAAWNALSIAEQRNEENIDSVKVELSGPAVNIRDKDTIRFEVESSAAIDWANSELYVARQAVTQRPFEG